MEKTDNKIDFTYGFYKRLIELLRGSGYDICSYYDWADRQRCVILRHDIDNSIDFAVKMADIEKSLGVSSTYFVLVSTDMYNFASKRSREGLKRIIDDGHEIGLHFDETAYPSSILRDGGVEHKILTEANMLSAALDGYPVRAFSYHRPSKATIEAEIEINGMINSYGHSFFHDFKYLSDSRRNWREPVLDLVSERQFQRLHILTHPFWYHENETDMHDTILDFINSANSERYGFFYDNFRDLAEVVSKEEVT